MDSQFALLLLLVSTVLSAGSNRPPNILFILTDDQDLNLNSMRAMKKTATLLGTKGASFLNAFVTSPLCCPSRTSILTGQYVHSHQTWNNSLSGNCSSKEWQSGAERRTFAPLLQQNGYRTFFAGKYLNQYGSQQCGGTEHVPPGWDWWIGLVGNSKYYDYDLSVNGTRMRRRRKTPSNYLTDVITTYADEFLRQQSALRPFFMFLSAPACHAPFTPAKRHRGAFRHLKAPRTASFNVSGTDKHWLIRSAKSPLSTLSVKYIDQVYRRRLRTLLAVDDLVETVVKTLEERQLMDNTYMIFTSDNGYHLGQFNLPSDKRQLYEFDIRVPLIIRGPLVPEDIQIKNVVLNIDLAPTFLDLAGIAVPSFMDGQSMLGLFRPPAVLSRDRTVLIEHSGEEQDVVVGCPAKSGQHVAVCFPDCVCEDSRNNTYACIRFTLHATNYKYCEFQDDEHFVEIYNLDEDPDEMRNLFLMNFDDAMKVAFRSKLKQMINCRGVDCR